MATTLARRRSRSRRAPRRSGPSPQVIKLRSQLQSTRKSAKRRVAKARTSHLLTSAATGALGGVLARLDLDLPVVGEIGTDAAAAAGLLLAGWYWRSDLMMDMGATFGAIAIHEFVEDSPTLKFLDK